MAGKQKLELTWIGKENRPRLEPRILLEDPEKSYHAAHRVFDDWAVKKSRRALPPHPSRRCCKMATRQKS